MVDQISEIIEKVELAWNEKPYGEDHEEKTVFEEDDGFDTWIKSRFYYSAEYSEHLTISRLRITY